MFSLDRIFFSISGLTVSIFDRTKLHLVVMEKTLLVDVVFDMQHAKVQCDVVVTIVVQAKQNLVFGLVSREITIMVTNLIPPIEKSSQQIQNSFAPHKKCGMSFIASQYKHLGVSFIFISNSFLLQLIILCIVLNCRDRFLSLVMFDIIVEKSLTIHHPKSGRLRWRSILWCL